MKTFLQRMLFSVAAAIMAATAFSQTPVLVTECDPKGWNWIGNGDASIAVPSSNPVTSYQASGSGQLKVGSNNNSYAGFSIASSPKTPVSSLTELRYSTYVQQDGGSGKAPRIRIEVTYDTDNKKNIKDNWYFEPSAANMGKWEEWNALEGLWYSGEKLAGSSAKSPRPLSDLLNATKGAQLQGARSIWIEAGSKDASWNNFDGNIDWVVIGLNGTSTTYDFTVSALQLVCPPDVREPAAEGFCEKEIALQAPTAVDPCTSEILEATGTRSDNQPMNAPFPAGTTEVTWAIADGSGNTIASCIQKVTVYDDQDPVITCPSNAPFNRDTDKDVCSYIVQGTEFDATATDNCSAFTLSYSIDNGPAVEASTLAGYELSKGEHTITWTATDGEGNTSSCSFTVTVVDNQPPVISDISASPNTLWSPNHKMVDVYLTYTVTDNCDNPVAPENITVTITSNEPLNDRGDGNTEIDWEVVDHQHIKLRAERAGLLEGRIYTITVNAKDDAGNEAEAQSTEVTVPHDQSKKAQTLDVQTGSNPSSGSFTLKVNSTNTTDEITMIVANASGRVVYSQKNIRAGQTIELGSDFLKGTYYVSFRQGSSTQQVQLLKL